MYDYMPFGQQINVKSNNSKDRLSFIGKENDAESGLGDFGVRKYDKGGRFLSIDPLWEKYYAWTPYHYCGNNPVNGTDPSGKVVMATGSSANEGISLINNEFSNISLSRNNESGLVTARIKHWDMTLAEMEVLSATTNNNINLTLNFTSENTMNDIRGNLQQVVGGMYGGSINNPDGTVSALQGININQLRIFESTPNSDRVGQNIIHEAIEGYEGAVLHPGTSYPVSFLDAHNRSLEIYPLPGHYNIQGRSNILHTGVNYYVNQQLLYTLPLNLFNEIQDNSNR